MVGGLSAFDPVNQDQNDRDAQNNIQEQAKFAKTVTPQQAQAAAQIYKNSPYIPARVVLDLAKSNPSPQTIDAVSKIAANQYVKNNQPNQQPKESWFARNVYGKAKAASRWSFAALQFAPDLVQNAASQVFSGNDPAGVDGWFASTQLGALASGKDAGRGFFLGGEAADTQAEKARQFRGTINGHAWTIGRGAADLVFTPGSREYSILSGFLDAAVQIYADPTMYVGQAFKAAKTGEQVKGLVGTKTLSQKLADQMVERGIVTSDKIERVTGEVAEAARKIAAGEAGLNSAEMATFESSKFFTWFDSNSKAARMAERIANYASEATRVITDKKLSAEAAQVQRAKVAAKIIEDFPEGSIDLATALRFAEADDTLKVKATLASVSGTDQAATAVTQLGEIRGLGATQALRERVPIYRTWRNSRFASEIPTDSIVLNGTDMDRTRGALNYMKFLKGLGWDKSTVVKETLDEIETLRKAAVAANQKNVIFNGKRYALQELTKLNDDIIGLDYDNFISEAFTTLSSGDVAARRTSMEQLHERFLRVISLAVGGDEDVTKLAYDLGKSKIAEMRAYAVDEMGNITDGGAFQMLRDYLSPEQLRRIEAQFSPDELNNLAFADPQSVVQLIDNMFVMPDYRKYRSLSESAWMKGVLRNAKGDQNKLLAAAEEFQQEIWKPVILATGGYIVRNMIDSHIRIAAAGYQGFFSHPFQYLQAVMGKTFIGALTGDEQGAVRTFEDIGEEFGTRFRDDIIEQHKQASSATVYQWLQNPLDSNQNLWRSDNWMSVNRGNDPSAHTLGYIDNLGQLRADPINSRLAAWWDLPATERRQNLVDWLNSDEGAKTKKMILETYARGKRIQDPVSGRSIFESIDITDDLAIATWIDKTSTSRVATTLRAANGVGPVDKDLRFIVAHDRVPRLIEVTDPQGVVIDVRVADEVSDLPVDELTYRAGNKVRGIGGTIVLDDGTDGIITKIETREVPDPFNPGQTEQRRFATAQPVAKGRAFTNKQNDAALLGTDAHREFINWKGAQNQLAQNITVAQRILPNKSKGLSRIYDAYNTGVSWFFENLVGVAQNKLERSPLWRQAFYKHVSENANLLAPSEQALLKSNIERYVKELNDDLIADGKKANVTVQKYVGGEDIYNRIFGQVSNGDATVAQLESFGGRVASKETQRILYNAHQKNNLEDMLRVLAPFATAFRETLGKYTQYLVEDPSRIRKTQLVFNAVNNNNQNPDDIGNGWFQKDEATGKHTFNVPLGGWIGPLLQFPVKGAFQVANLPGLGPVAQIAASEILPDTPRLDFVRKLILPYGEQGVSSLAPQWARRGIEAIRANTTDMSTVYGQTYGDVVKYLVQSGEYDMKDPNEVSKLYADARNKARVLAGLRALFQFTGPTSPQIDFRLETDGGDIIASAISQEFYKLQTNNRDTAVQEFIKKFGEDAFIYLSSKTESVAGGLEVSDAFGDWQRENSDLFNEYKDVAGYFAPSGDDFSFEVFNRQIKKGERRRLTAPEIVEAAQYRLGMSIYRSKRAELGDKISREQRDWLAQWRTYLNQQYPGFPAKAQFNPGELDKFVGDLKRAVGDERLKDNDVAGAVRQYLDARDKAFAQAKVGGLSDLSSDRAQPLRDWLSSIANTLIQQTPEFSRIFEDKLAAEVD
jgi:polyhydroxyalkanoate synthesis regulator phasin